MKKKKVNKPLKEVLDYDNTETLHMIDSNSLLRFEDIGYKLPEQPPTQVISIRLSTDLLNEIKAFSSERDIPYQAMIKLFLSDKMAERRGSRK